MGLFDSLFGRSEHQRQRDAKERDKAARAATRELLKNKTVAEIHAEKLAQIDAELAKPDLPPAHRKAFEAARKKLVG
jgi:hypothetical protein